VAKKPPKRGRANKQTRTHQPQTIMAHNRERQPEDHTERKRRLRKDTRKRKKPTKGSLKRKSRTIIQTDPHGAMRPQQIQAEHLGGSYPK